MDIHWQSDPAWCHALTLAERNALLADGVDTAHLPDEIRDRARRRLERWQSQPPFDLDGLADADDAIRFLAQRLAADGIDPARLADLLATPVETLHDHLTQTPEWAAEWVTAFATPSPPPVPAESDADDPDDTPTVPAPPNDLFRFLALVNPLITLACSRLQAGIDQLVARDQVLPFDPAIIEDIFLENLPDPLIMRISRTLVLELHVARLQGHLVGDTPAARFDSFIERLRQPEHALAILTEYPVLARQLTILLRQWTAVSLEFLTRLTDDWELIRQRFSPDEDPGILVALAGGAGDTHRGGRSVMIATFESGFRIVYKPKSLAVDAHFQDLLAWLNARGCEPPLQTIDIMDRGQYGWVQHVAYRTCETPEELQRFYLRHGAYLALLHALNSNDFHFENLIAVGEHPILIDLETVLQPRFERFNESWADGLTVQIMAESVLQVGLLPLRLWSGADYAGIDISGLGGNAGQLTPDRIPRVTESGTDEMRYIRERVEIEGDANRPSLNGTVVNATEHVDDILTGFTGIYRLLMAHRDELISDDGLLARFAHDDIRVLLRPTRTYDQLLFESFHPDFLRNALDRDQFLDRLWVAAPVRTYLAQVIPGEQADMRQGDIPIFETTPSALHLVNGSGRIAEGVLTETGMDAVRRRIQGMSEEELRRQCWFIRASLATIAASDARGATSSYRLTATDATVDPARLRDHVRAIAERLHETAIIGDEDACWVGLELIDTQTWEIRSLGLDLENGTSGVVLFLAYAGALLDEERYTRLAQFGLNLLDRQIEMLREEWRNVGLYDGWGGVIYTLAHLATLWQDPSLRTRADGLINLVANLAVQDETLDVARGAAGALLTMLAYHRHFGSEAALAAAIACGNHLLSSARPDGYGLTWSVPAAGARPGTGSTHGSAGIIWALSELAAATGSERYAQAARQALARQRRLFAGDVADWPGQHQADLRGTAGIGPAWVATLHALDDDRLAREVDAITQATLAHGFGNHHGLVDGDLGSVELLLACAGGLDDHWTRAQAEQLAAMVLDSLERDGLRCGGPLAVEMPGLALGIAGIGYQLLRLLAPERVPSLLQVALPVDNAGTETQPIPDIEHEHG